MLKTWNLSVDRLKKIVLGICRHNVYSLVVMFCMYRLRKNTFLIFSFRLECMYYTSSVAFVLSVWKKWILQNVYSRVGPVSFTSTDFDMAYLFPIPQWCALWTNQKEVSVNFGFKYSVTALDFANMVWWG